MNREKKTFFSAKLLYASLAFVFMVLSGLQLFFANNLATEGTQIKKMEVVLESLENEAKVLEDQLVELGRLQRIKKDAQEVLGMATSGGKVSYVFRLTVVD